MTSVNAFATLLEAFFNIFLRTHTHTPEEVGHGTRHEVIIDFVVSAFENSKGRVTEAHDDFSFVGKVLIVDNRSALVAYLKCHYFLSRCS